MNWSWWLKCSGARKKYRNLVGSNIFSCFTLPQTQLSNFALKRRKQREPKFLSVSQVDQSCFFVVLSSSTRQVQEKLFSFHFIVIDSAVPSIKLGSFGERQESNPGRLRENRKCCLCSKPFSVQD